MSTDLPDRDRINARIDRGDGIDKWEYYPVIKAWRLSELLTPREALDKSYQHFIENCNCSCCDIHANLIMDALGAPEVDGG